MNFLYDLLDSEDLFRIPKDIKSRFAKLTLSKKKEIRKSISENKSEIGELLRRNIIEELLSDDSSEGEADAINRIFLSKSITNLKESDEKVPISSEKIDAIMISSDTENENVEKLVLNDSDVTHCSIYEEDYNREPLQKTESVLGMERLQVTENIVLTNSENLFNQQFNKNIEGNAVDILSQKVSSLEINSPKKNVIAAETTVENIKIISIDSPRNSGIHNAIINIKSEINESILTISSANTTPAKKSNGTDDDLSGSEEDVIVITDSDDEQIEEYEKHVSDMRQSGQTNLCSTLSNTRADRVEAFLQDLKEISQSQINENCSKIVEQHSDDEKISLQSLKSNESSSAPNESIEIAETSTEHEHEISGCMESEKNVKMPSIDQESPTLEDHSPLIQTEKQSANTPTPQHASEPSPEHSSESGEEEISISARFNIKIHFSQPMTIVRNHNSSESDERGTKESSVRNSKTSTQTTSSADIRESEHYQENQKMTPNKLLSVEKIVTPVVTNDDASSLDDVDDKAKEILTKLYGNTWQTPDIIKKLDRKTNSPANQQSPVVVQNSSGTKMNGLINKNISPLVNRSCQQTDTTVTDFSMFHKNIRCDLESTRLKSPTKSTAEFKRPQTERKPNALKNNERKCQSVKTKSGREVKRRNYSLDSSDDSSDTSSDENTKYSSTSVDDESIKKRIRKPREKKSDQNELIYMDLSTDVVKIVDETVRRTPKKRSDSNEKLQNILKSCTFDGKKKIPVTPKNTLTKRKLFTPQFGNEEEIQLFSPIRPAIIASDEIKLKIPLPSIFAPPLNKALESVKTGTPIFKLPTPTKKTPKSIKNKEKSKENTPPVTPKNLKHIKKTLADEFLDDNSNKTYGFLQSLDVITPKSLCHPEALIYRDKFRQTKNDLVDKLYKLFNEKIFEFKVDVPIIWNKKLQNTAGRCCNRKKGNICSSTVELSEKVLTSADRLRCTLIHELCHAATWIFSGENGHGATWKSWARKANNVFPELPFIGVCHEYDIEYKYTYKCTVCEAKSNAHSRSKKVENIRCSYCHGKIVILLNKKNKDGIIVSTPVKSASGFAKFVKEKYKLYKRPNINHAEVMKMLSAEFAGLSVEEKSKF